MELSFFRRCKQQLRESMNPALKTQEKDEIILLTKKVKYQNNELMRYFDKLYSLVPKVFDLYIKHIKNVDIKYKSQQSNKTVVKETDFARS